MDKAGESTARDEVTNSAGGPPAAAAANLARNVALNGQRSGESADPDVDDVPEEHDATWIYKQLGLSPEAYKGDVSRTERRPASPLPPVGRASTNRPIAGLGLGPGLDFDLAADLAAEDPHDSPFPPGSLGRDEDMPTGGPKAKPFVHHQSGTTAPIIPGSVPASALQAAHAAGAAAETTAEAAKTEAAKTEAAKTEAPKVDAAKTHKASSPAAAEQPKFETPKSQAPRTETPKTDPPRTEAPRTEAPTTEAPTTEAHGTAKAAPAAASEQPVAERPRPAVARPAARAVREPEPQQEENPFRAYDESSRGVLPPLPPLPEPLRSTETGRGVRSWESPLPEDDKRITADHLTADKVLKGRKAKPTRGWRKGLASMGVNLGPSAKERTLQEFESRVRTPIHGCHRLAVISLKGGVGKTTTIAAMGSVFASLRGDRVIAVDANPDRGTLGEKIVGEVPPATVRDFVGRIPRLTKYSDIREFIGQAGSRLEVLASEADPLASLAFSEQDYRVIAEVLERFYNLILTDCGTGLLHSAMVGVLAKAEQVVIVSSASLDGARSASATLDWLEAHGYQELARESVSVISTVRTKADGVHLSEIESHFAARTRAVVSIPYDPHLAEGGMIDLDALHPKTYRAYLELAATVADGFARSVGYR